MSSPTAKPRHAVVIGGSLAGLCAARALVEHVEQVTVVDRDRFPDGPRVRKGVPQAHHLHVLLTAGQRSLDVLFPGLMAELRERGAVPVAAPTDILYLSPTGWRERFPATHTLVGASRELIDWVVYRGWPPTNGSGFSPAATRSDCWPHPTPTPSPACSLRRRDGDGQTERLMADLVVDASGRGSRSPDWLATLGYGRPDETRIDSGLGYASRRYRLRDGAADGWKTVLLMPQPPHISRGGVLYPVEDGRWMVTLGGLGDDRPPTDEAGFLGFARGLRSPLLYEAIVDAEPDSRSTASGRPPTTAATTRACRAGPTGTWWSVTRRARSTRCTARV